MRFLADENCDLAVVRALRSAGHDVVAVAERSPRAEDPEVIHLALSEGRIVLTEDKDFGWPTRGKVWRPAYSGVCRRASRSSSDQAQTIGLARIIHEA